MLLKNGEVVEDQRRWSVKYGIPQPTRAAITRIRDKFQVDETVQDVMKVRKKEKFH